ncbi:MAG: phasin family protein, partial [Candidatus Competibacteraceae bacterium]|nr:phasin family protein [Candidatus Competibacteraceae bacterium]
AMAKTPKSASEHDASSAITEASADGLAAAMRMSQTWMAGYNAYQRHMMEFMNQRWRRDFETMQRFSTCRDGAEAMQLQTEFVQQLVEDYVREGQALMQLGAEMAKGAGLPGGLSDPGKD